MLSHQTLSGLIATFLGSLLLATSAFGWGNFAHEKSNEAAVHLLVAQRHPLATMLTDHIEVLSRLGKTPDVDWKWVTETQGKKKQQVLTHDERFHFFYADAFVNPRAEESAILSLPAQDYRVAYNRFVNLMAATSNYRKEFSGVVAGKSAEDYGLAPWRVLQIYDLAVVALKARALKPALFYLGVLGHYVADLAQPFQTTLNRDGQVYALPARGIHNAFGTGIFEVDGVRAAFDASGAAKNALGTKGLDGLTRDRILPELFKLVNSGYVFLEPLLKAFAEQRRSIEDRGETTEIPPTVIAAFAKAPAFQKWTPVQLAESRLGEAAMLTARLWAAAFHEAGNPVIDDQKLTFEDLKASSHYPTANFLPISYK